ncbi:hypothetical protein O7602_16600 [Micromonospora sp. WMMD1128]|uniref:hypothetical protein n=1 Tax=Micromonospora sp. WMMD1128 TaxID=3015150 RepID=UPI00248D04E4|nr:hypothetical protein [Micromonospora sp. WMMD1128]WBB71381.1 hypothetical protein O7602_16600 [Micromonospora sp. WMMD1128]
MDRRRHRTRWALAAVPVGILLVAGCTSRPAAPQPSPEPTSTVRLGTVARADVGARLTMTATVERVISDTAFVVHDVDLTEGTLLVLSTAAPAPEPPQLVTVRGTVVDFSHRELDGRYRLGDSGPYRAFEGGRALAADEVTAWD